MQVLIAGHSEVIGKAIIQELLNRRHGVRLLSANPEDDPRQWPAVEVFRGGLDATEGACAGCDVVVIIGDAPANGLVDEAERASVRRLVMVRSIGIDALNTKLDWIVLRSTHVYGPGDAIVSALLKAIRTLPALPQIAGGSEPFQPIWHEDLAKAVAAAAERTDLTRTTLNVAGAEVTSAEEILERLERITERKPLRVPPPGDVLPELRGGDVLSGTNALTATLGVVPTPLDRALRLLADALPEQLPDEGVGRVRHKKFWAEMSGSKLRAASLMSLVRDRFDDVMPIDVSAEPRTSSRIERGKTVTMSMPMRGNVQVRVEVVEPTRFLLVTLEGHPLAGSVQFSTSEQADRVTFAVDVYANAANKLDWLAINTVGAPMQDANWKKVVQRVIDLSGGVADAGVQSTSQTLSEEETAAVASGLRSAIYARQREESAREAENAAQR